MIRILGSFKVVPDLDQLSENDWIADSSLKIDTSFVKKIISCYDESGLELMLKCADIAEEQNLQVQLDAVTIGAKVTENYLKTLYALGFAETTRIECEEQNQFWPELTAGLLTEYVNRVSSYDIIVVGNRSADEENGKTVFLLAEQLGWPCVSQVTNFEPVDDTHIKVYYEEENTSYIGIVELPCVLSIGDVPCSYLRVPTLKDRMQKGKKEIKHFTMQELGIGKEYEGIQPDASLVQLKKVDQTRAGIRLKADSVREVAQRLYEEYLKGKVMD